MDVGHRDVESQGLDALRPTRSQRTVGGLADLQRFGTEGLWPRPWLAWKRLGDVVDDPPDALDEAPGTGDACFRPDHVALGRASRTA